MADNMLINFLEQLEEDESEKHVFEPMRGSLYPGEGLRFRYDNEKLIDVSYERKNCFYN